MSIIEQALLKRRTQRPEAGGAPSLPGGAAEGPEGAAASGSPGDPAEGHAALAAGGAGAASRPVDIEIDYATLRRLGVMIPGESRDALVEELRIIKRPLLTNAFQPDASLAIERGRLIMVTSAIPGEGKSFSTVNLALSMALEVERTVLLVDADFSRPNIPATLGFSAELGLMDVLTEPEVGLEDVILRTQIPNLSVLPAGRTHQRATELLASSAMARLLEEMHDRYPDRVILFDTPPLLASSEPSVLASQMGQVVLVVEAESTPSAAIRRAAERLAACDVVHTLLNKAAGWSGLEYGAGAGGYGYGLGGYGHRGEQRGAPAGQER